MLGICFGHKLMAWALCGRVEKYPGGWSVGPEVYEFDGISDKACVMSWHQDQVIEKPAAAEIAGSSAFCKYAALCHTAIGRLLFNLILNSTPCMLLTLSWRDEPCCLIMAEKTLTGLDKSLLSAAIADQIEVFSRNRGESWRRACRNVSEGIYKGCNSVPWCAKVVT